MLDDQLLEFVCGQPVDKLLRQPARLPGFESRYVVDKPFPVLVLAPKSSTAGMVIEFDDTLMARLLRYEREDFELCEVSVMLDAGGDVNCHYFANVGFTAISQKRWTLEEFQRLHKDAFMSRLIDEGVFNS